VVQLRKEHLDLVYGKYTLLDKNNPNVYAYTREREGENILVVLNFTSHNAKVNIDLNLKNATMLLSNYDSAPVLKKATISLKPYEAVVYKLNK
jgi:oligo-1,6-glucosidase